jgi:methylamine dehydrogenase accessory protein MauD
MSAFLLTCNLALWGLVLVLGFLLLGALRAVALLRWQVAQLEATTPSRLGRSGLRPGQRAPDFALPTVDGGQVALEHYAGRQLFLVFMQPHCGSCQRISPELDRLHDSGAVQVLVVQNGDAEGVRRETDEHPTRFPVALQERFTLSKRYQVFATPFAFLIDERGVIAARGIVSTKQYLGFVLSRAGHEDKEGEAESSGESQRLASDAAGSSHSSSKEVDHV